MRKVTATGAAPVVINSKAKKVWLVFGALIFLGLGAVFGPKLTIIMDKIFGHQNLDNIPTPTNTPFVSQKANVVETFEPTAEPTSIIEPEVVQTSKEEIIETQAKENYAKLILTKSDKFVYPFTYEDVYGLVRIAHGDLEYLINLPTTSSVIDNGYIESFNSLDNSDRNTVMVELYNRLLVTILGHTNTVIQAGLEVIFDGKEVKIHNPESYKNFEREDETYAKGAETLKLLEDMGQNVYDSLNADWETFEANAKAYQGLVAAIFPDGANVWGGNYLTAFSNMDNELRATLYIEAQGPLALIFARSQRDGKVIATGNNDCYTTAYLINDLCEENYTITEDDIKALEAQGIVLDCKAGDRINVYSYRISSKLFGDIVARFDKVLPQPEPSPELTYEP